MGSSSSNISGSNALPTSAKPLNLLVVEDHVDSAKMLARLLKTLGHSVKLAGTVAEAVQDARSGTFDMVISDLGLPDASGIDLIKEIRTFSAMPAIALSGFGMDDDIEQCLAAGFNDHLTKPPDFQKLAAMLNRLAS